LSQLEKNKEKNRLSRSEYRLKDLWKNNKCVMFLSQSSRKERERTQNWKKHLKYGYKLSQISKRHKSRYSMNSELQRRYTK
jgi:hypothetical protein